MRIAVAHFIHESNSFAAEPTRYEDFRALRGDAIARHYVGSFNEVGGFIEGGERNGFEPLLTFSATATPAGPLTRDAYERLTGEMLAELKAAEPFDGILLALHGAMVAEHFPHADAETARRVRAAYPALPIVATHDPHSHISAEVVAQLDALVVYKTNPHIDQRDIGLQAADMVARIVRGEAKPTMSYRSVPLFVNIVHQKTSAPPLRDLWNELRAMEKLPGVLAASMSLSYQYADVPAMGNAAVVVTDNDQALADKLAGELAAKLWALREELEVRIPDLATAVSLARESRQTPVCIVDIGDNIGGGSAGDSTFLLDELVKQNADGWVVVLYDPDNVQACAKAGIGASLTLDVGGKTDNLHGAPVRVTGRVKCLHDGRYEEHEARHGGQRFHDQGLTALLEIPTPAMPSYVLLTSRREAPMSLHQLLSVGIQAKHMKILTVKAAIAWRAAYEPIAGDIIVADTPGATQVNPARWRYQHTRPDLWGLQGW